MMLLKKVRSCWHRHRDKKVYSFWFVVGVKHFNCPHIYELLKETIYKITITRNHKLQTRNAQKMTLEILTPERKLFSGEVYGVQMPGISGSFEVLDKHAPLVSALKAGRVKVLRDKQNHTSNFDIQGGFVEVLNNKVTVLVEGATAVE